MGAVVAMVTTGTTAREQAVREASGCDWVMVGAMVRAAVAAMVRVAATAVARV
jgi:hypothetical protein